jgi:hypothetical protein
MPYGCSAWLACFSLTDRSLSQRARNVVLMTRSAVIIAASACGERGVRLDKHHPVFDRTLSGSGQILQGRHRNEEAEKRSRIV